MAGAFYGSLATSASVFVAILTALLVNTYVQIKSDRRHIKNELDRIEEDLQGLTDRRDDYQDTVDNLVGKREADYREKAKNQVDEFIESGIPSEIDTPIEELSVDKLYQKLIDFHDCESAEDLEDSSINQPHRDLLEERREDIEDQILNNIIPSFAHEYQGRGWKDEREEEGSEAEAENRKRDPLDLDEFIEKYKEKFDLSSLDDKTIAELEVQYDEIVDKNPTTDSHGTDPSSPLRRIQEELAGTQIEQPDPIDSDLAEINPTLGLSIREKQKLEKARENLQDKKNEIEILKQRQGRLKREEERLHPEDLIPTLVANVATIILSVVIPIIIYLIFVTNSAVVPPDWAELISHTKVNVFLSWLLGLCVVFESIYARINDREPKAYSIYQRIRKYFSRKREKYAGRI